MQHIPYYILNSLKISFTAIIAIILALILGLSHPVSAGILAILTIQPTKRETFQTAGTRFFAFLLALAIAKISFSVFGFHISAFFAYLFTYVLLCEKFRWHNAITTNSVLISHFVTHGSMDVPYLINESALFCLGIGSGILANLHLHKKTNSMERLKNEADAQMKMILAYMAERIMNENFKEYNYDCFLTLKRQIRKAKNFAERNYKNQFKRNDRYDIEYIAMRDRQCHILYEMYKNVSHLGSQPDTADKIADFIRLMSKSYDRDNNGIALMEQFKEMDTKLKSRPLPLTRTEFEDRARLFILLRNIEDFIKIKMEFARLSEQVPLR